jgi:hypothetical protein
MVEREGKRRQRMKWGRKRERGKEDREVKTRKGRQGRKGRQRREGVELQYMYTALNNFVTITQYVKIQEKFSTTFNNSMIAIQYKKI